MLAGQHDDLLVGKVKGFIMVRDYHVIIMADEHQHRHGQAGSYGSEILQIVSNRRRLEQNSGETLISRHPLHGRPNLSLRRLAICRPVPAGAWLMVS